MEEPRRFLAKGICFYRASTKKLRNKLHTQNYRLEEDCLSEDMLEDKYNKCLSFHEILEDKFDKLFTLCWSFSEVELHKTDEAYLKEILTA